MWYLLVSLALSSTVVLATDPGSSSSCDFNWDVTPANWKTGTPERRTPRPQGFVEDFGNRLTDRPYRVWSAGVNRFVLGNDACDSPDQREFTLVNCSGAQGHGYFYALDSINHQGLTEYWDRETEELVFLTALKGVHEFASCQAGVFDSYFGSATTQADLERDAYTALLGVVSAYKEQETLRRTREQRGIHASDEWIEGNITRLMARVPMGNRDLMRDALVELVRYHARRDPNDVFGSWTIPFDTFREVYRQKMRLMADQTAATLNRIEGPRGPDGQRRGGIVRRSADGQQRYCIDTGLKTYLWRSGQVAATLDQYQVKSQLTPGFMCREKNRYGVEGAYAAEIALIPTYFLGYGAARMAVRAGVAGVRAVTAGGEVLTGSRMMMLGLEGANWLTSAAMISRDCNLEELFSRVTKHSCDPEQELRQVYQEASLGQCLTTAFVAGATPFIGAAARTLLTERAVVREAQTVERAAADVPEIVVTATRPRSPPPRAEAPPARVVSELPTPAPAPAPLVEDAQSQLWALREAGRSGDASAFEDRLARTLREGTMREVPDAVLDGTTGPKLVAFPDGTRGIWKPYYHEGVVSGDRELAAYEVDRLLGLNAVPVTVEREFGGVRGTVQLFVPGNTRRMPGFPDELAWFDYLIANRDRNIGNVLSVGDRIVAIDNGVAFSARPLPQFTDTVAGLRASGRPEALRALQDVLPGASTVDALRRMTPSLVRERLSGRLGEDQILALIDRRNTILSTVNETQLQLPNFTLRTDGSIRPMASRPGVDFSLAPPPAPASAADSLPYLDDARRARVAAQFPEPPSAITPTLAESLNDYQRIYAVEEIAGVRLTGREAQDLLAANDAVTGGIGDMSLEVAQLKDRLTWILRAHGREASAARSVANDLVRRRILGGI